MSEVPIGGFASGKGEAYVVLVAAVVVLRGDAVAIAAVVRIVANTVYITMLNLLVRLFHIWRLESMTRYTIRISFFNST